MAVPDAEPHPPEPDQLYGADYYAHYHSGSEHVAYDRSEHWLGFFGAVAGRIVADIAPRTALDAGCAIGLLVEALRDRGVAASGFDVSEYAISQVREDVRSHCRVGDILQPIDGRYDLVTCIEVLEHLEEAGADRAVANLCAITDDVVFTSTPDDFAEETHLNVRPPEYWVGLFARHGFAHDLGFDGTFLAGWAMRFRRARDPWHRLAVEYDREWWRLRRENLERSRVVLEQRDRVAHSEAQLAAATEDRERLAQELERLRRELTETRQRLDAYDGSVAVRLAVRAHRALAGPPGSWRGRAVSALTRRARH